MTGTTPTVKTTLPFLFVILLFSNAESFALPPRQHLAKGTVAAIDREQITVVPSRPEKDEPTSFTIQEGRTPLRKDGRSAPAEQLSVGQSVRLYYKREMGAWVATEVAWKTDDLPRK